MSYNLDTLLNSVNRLLGKKDFVDSLTFDQNNDRGAISSIHIKNASIGTAQIGSISFNNIAGGTATLGGTANGNGVLSVRNQSGSEVVLLNSSGITVRNGSITVQDSSGTDIIDSTGLVSTVNFRFGQGTASADQTITALTPTFSDITGGSVTIPLTRSTNVFLTASVTARHNNDGDGIARVRFVYGGTANTEIGPNILIRTFGTGEFNVAQTHSTAFVQQFAAGTHTVRLQCTQNNNPGTVVFTTEGLNTQHTVITYTILGA